MITDIQLLYLLWNLEEKLYRDEFNDVSECLKYLITQYILFNEKNYSLKEVIEDFKANTTTM